MIGSSCTFDKQEGLLAVDYSNAGETITSVRLGFIPTQAVLEGSTALLYIFPEVRSLILHVAKFSSKLCLKMKAVIFFLRVSEEQHDLTKGPLCSGVSLYMRSALSTKN